MVGSTRRVNSRLVKLRRGPSSATVCFRLANWECIVGRPLMPYTNAIRCRIWGTEHEVQAIRHSCARPPTTWPSVGQSCIGAYRHGTYQSHQIGVLWTGRLIAAAERLGWTPVDDIVRRSVGYYRRCYRVLRTTAALIWEWLFDEEGVKISEGRKGDAVCLLPSQQRPTARSFSHHKGMCTNVKLFEVWVVTNDWITSTWPDSDFVLRGVAIN